MKRFFFYSFILFFTSSCFKKTEKQAVDKENSISKNVSIVESKTKILLHTNEFDYTFDKSKLPFKKIVLLNASLLGYISALNSENKIVGVVSPQYIYSGKIHKRIAEEKISNVGNDQKYNLEKIISLQPDAIFTNYIPNFENTYDILKKNGIQVIFLNEYTEQKPLEKAAYLKIFGPLLGKQKKADSLYQVIQNNYSSLQQIALSSKTQPTVLTNEMYGNQWYMPGGKTQLANYLKDANTHYLLKDNMETRSIPMSFEEVFSKCQNATHWVNVGSHTTKKELVAIQPNYAKLNVFQNGKIFNINKRVKGSANDYFESGSVRVDWVLKDYINVLHPELFPNENTTYISELK